MKKTVGLSELMNITWC